jgi:hypothetical protein
MIRHFKIVIKKNRSSKKHFFSFFSQKNPVATPIPTGDGMNDRAFQDSLTAAFTNRALEANDGKEGEKKIFD